MAAAARVVAADREGLAAAGARLRAGGNVAFPTETVYGLGGNALDEAAVRRIFTFKGRPLTDPLIVHVPDAEAALGFVRAEGETRRIFEALAAKFWPGPLTMVLAADDKVPPAVCANTGFVGVRAPSHPVARDLLLESGVPVAAPSANRFGHVSPTSAQHVADDLGAHDILIVDGGDVTNGTTCSVGIESTVLKVEDSDVPCDATDVPRKLILFRKGGVPETAIRAALDEAGFTHVEIVPPPAFRDSSHDSADASASACDSSKSAADLAAEQAEQAGAQQAPGQLITHYAPDVDTWLLRAPSALATADPAGVPAVVETQQGKRLPLRSSVLLDFGGTLKGLRDNVLAYRDLSPDSDVPSAARSLFDALRWTESVDGAEHVLIVDVAGTDDPLAPSVTDRMFRAASGKVSEGARITAE